MIHINLNEEIKMKLKEIANEKGLSLSAYIRMILLEKCKENTEKN